MRSRNIYSYTSIETTSGVALCWSLGRIIQTDELKLHGPIWKNRSNHEIKCFYSILSAASNQRSFKLLFLRLCVSWWCLILLWNHWLPHNPPSQLVESLCVCVSVCVCVYSKSRLSPMLPADLAEVLSSEKSRLKLIQERFFRCETFLGPQSKPFKPF